MSVKESVLEALNQNKGTYLSGGKLSEELGVSRAAVWKAIGALREEGYRIDAVTNRGYCLSETEAPLSESEIRRFLPARYRNNGLYVYDIIDSTNNRARQIAVGMAPDLIAEDAEPATEESMTATRSRQSAVEAAATGNMAATPSWESIAGSVAEAGTEADTGNLSKPSQPAPIHGSTVVALQQTGGKGRLGRSFFSPKEGIYLSIIVRPELDLSKSVLVTVAAAAAVAEAIDAVRGLDGPTTSSQVPSGAAAISGQEPPSAAAASGQNAATPHLHTNNTASANAVPQPAQIKWVNDVYLNGRKVCGILTEGISDFETGRIEHLVIGIGINTCLDGFPEELLQTAGAVEGDYSKSELAAGIITRVLDYMENIEEKPFLDSYRSRSMLIGRDVRVFKGVYRSDPEKDLSGRPARVLGIDDNGGLEVIYTDGSRETLTTGEVTIRA